MRPVGLIAIVVLGGWVSAAASQARLRQIDSDARVQAPPVPRPAWEARPVSPDARMVERSTYIVRHGDTLQRVGEASGAGGEAIARANGLAPPYVLRAGQRLHIPRGRYHLVHSGESGIAIARAYSVEWSRIVEANALKQPYLLRAGQRIDVPLRPANRSSAAERAAAFRLDIDDIITGGEPALARNKASAKLAASPALAVRVRPRSSFIWPVQGQLVGRFGPGRSGERLNGVKIAVPADTPIKATTDGVVAYAGAGVVGLGGIVIIRHGGGWTSVYGHASRLIVQRGQGVKQGQPVALSGATGGADRPELHFELRRGRAPVDPLGQLPRR